MIVYVYDWLDGYRWAPDPTTYPKVNLRQYDPGDQRLGTSVSFDIPNKEIYSDGSKGTDRHIMEGLEVRLLMPTLTIEGFTHVQRFGPQADNQPDLGLYYKQRWVIR